MKTNKMTCEVAIHHIDNINQHSLSDFEFIAIEQVRDLNIRFSLEKRLLTREAYCRQYTTLHEPTVCVKQTGRIPFQEQK